MNWDGGYAPCCYLTDAKDDFANVNDSSIRQIWNGPQYTKARKMFTIKGYIPTVPVGCSTCNVYTESAAGVYTASLGGSKPTVSVPAYSGEQNGHHFAGNAKFTGLKPKTQNGAAKNPMGVAVAPSPDDKKN